MSNIVDILEAIIKKIHNKMYLFDKFLTYIHKENYRDNKGNC